MASRGVNKVILVGHLGQEPEIRYMPNGGAVATLSLATSDSWRDKASGEEKTRTEWHRVVLFAKLAEIAGEYLHKGSQVYIEGQLRTRSWQDEAGTTRYTTEIHVGQNGSMQMLGSRREDSPPSQPRQQAQQPQQQPGQNDTPAPAKSKKSRPVKSVKSEPSQQQGAWPPVGESDFPDDNIPF